MSRKLFVVILVLVAPVTSDLYGQTDQITKEVSGQINAAGQTQENLDVWTQEKEALELRYRAAQLNIFYLKDRVEMAESRAGVLDDQVFELQRRMKESEQLHTVINDTLQSVYSRLENMVASGQPFLLEERTQRLDRLRTTLVREDVNEAEKLRRLLEAVLIEAKYGETVEMTQESITINGELLFVDLLRIGRLSMFWQTPDKSQTGTFDPVESAYVELPAQYARSITQAMEMADNMRPVELISLPLGRIER